MLPNLPPGLPSPVFLSITPTSLSSVLVSPLPSSGPRYLRRSIQYVRAVIADSFSPLGEDNSKNYTSSGSNIPFGRDCYINTAPKTVSSFNVVVQSLLDELFPTVAVRIQHPSELVPRVASNKIWCAAGRFGVFTIPSE